MRKDRGFSLVEVMVVLAIMAVLALIAVPWFYKIAQRQQLKSAAFEIQTTLLAARMKAVKLNQPVTVAINSTANPVQLQTFEPPPPAPTPTKVPALMTLPANAATLATTPQVAGGGITFSGDGRINMAPTPAATPGCWYFTVQGPVGAATPNQIQVQAWPNGRVKVVTPTDWY
ncbi:MAG TPA: GspH/FimT family pseudopilin [Thermoanaerobaculia bacterium]|nr:GspH/FimT family pseudopilin [Thermoanaerobaculia bacterium]